MGVHTEGHVFGQCPHFDCQHALGDKSLRPAARDTHTEDAACASIECH